MGIRIYNKVDKDYICSECANVVFLRASICEHCKVKLRGFSRNFEHLNVSKKADYYNNELEKVLGKRIKQGLICPKCESPQKNNNAVFCIKCGESLFPKKSIKIKQCPDCKSNYNVDDIFCDIDGKKLINKKIEVDGDNPNYKIINQKKSERKNNDSSDELPMNWYRFITYIMCPISLFVSFGMILLPYSEPYSSAYYLFDLILICILLYGLASKTSWSWKLLLVLYILNSIFGRIDYVEEWGPIFYLMFVLIVNVSTTFPNYLYFNKRKHLFIN